MPTTNDHSRARSTLPCSSLTESAVDPLPVGVAGTLVIAGTRAVAGAVVRARGRGDADESESYEKTERHRRGF